jgi:hypothetical protein
MDGELRTARDDRGERDRFLPSASAGVASSIVIKAAARATRDDKDMR